VRIRRALQAEAVVVRVSGIYLVPRVRRWPLDLTVRRRPDRLLQTQELLMKRQKEMEDEERLKRNREARVRDKTGGEGGSVLGDWGSGPD
jgi:hypothetical protein